MFCSKWGHNRVFEYEATAVPVSLVLPVLTKPEIVEQAVAGILSGQISLSMSNVEAVLVLANAVRVSQLPLSPASDQWHLPLSDRTLLATQLRLSETVCVWCSLFPWRQPAQTISVFKHRK